MINRLDKLFLSRLAGLLFACLLTAIPARGQQATDARSILDRAADAFRQAGGVEMRFEVKTADSESEGIIVLKGERFRLTSEGMTTWFDGRTQWTYLADCQEVNITTPTAEELQTMNPYAWLSMSDKTYRLKVLKSDSRQVSIQMSATHRAQTVASLVVNLDRSTYRPLKVTFVPQGSRQAVVIEVKRYQDGKNYDDQEFVWDAARYPDAEIIDLR